MELATPQLRAILDSLEQGIGLLDRSGAVLYVNEAMARILGSEPGDVIGGGIHDVLPALRGEIDWCHAARNAVERGRTVRLSQHALEGGLRVDVTLAPVAFDEERYALLTVEEVSEEVQNQARLLRQARTQAIANLGDSVAHEIRNPLNSIHMNVQLLREGLNADPPDHERLDRTATTVQREIKRLDGVVRDFVQFSRPPALRLHGGSINHVVRAALESLDAQIREKGLQIETDLQSARPVHMDRDRLQRAIYNVLLNAVQVLPRGGSIICRSRDERRCLLEIQDDGPGLAPAATAHIFELFYTTKGGGTGLGLPIANRIVEEHGGRMAVASEPGRGTTFAFFLPYEGPPPPSADGPTTVSKLPAENE